MTDLLPCAKEIRQRCTNEGYFSSSEQKYCSIYCTLDVNTDGLYAERLYGICCLFYLIFFYRLCNANLSHIVILTMKPKGTVLILL